MRFPHIYRITSDLVDQPQVSGKHVWVLVIFRRDILFDCDRKGHRMRSPEREIQSVASRHQSEELNHCQISSYKHNLLGHV